MTTYKRGKKPARPGAILLRFGDYLNRKRMPVVPAVFGHANSAPPGGWDMDANNQAGCCVVSGGEHESMVWAMATGNSIPSFGTAVSLGNYSAALVAEGGVPYNPDDSSTDTGLDVALAAAFRQKVGFIDASGFAHKINAYAAVSGLQQTVEAAYCFGVCGIGLNLPGSADDQFDAGHVWDDLKTMPSGGHYVPVVGRNSDGNIMVITWGRLQAMTPAYFDKWVDEAVAYFSLEYLMATGLSPEAIDQAQLEDDLENIRNA